MAREFIQRHIDRREALIAEAMAAGKFPASRADTYRAAYDADPTGTAATIAKLAASVPAAQAAIMSGPAYNPGWLSDIERRRAEAAQRGEVPTIQMGE